MREMGRGGLEPALTGRMRPKWNHSLSACNSNVIALWQRWEVAIKAPHIWRQTSVEVSGPPCSNSSIPLGGRGGRSCLTMISGGVGVTRHSTKPVRAILRIGRTYAKDVLPARFGRMRHRRDTRVASLAAWRRRRTGTGRCAPA